MSAGLSRLTRWRLLIPDAPVVRAVAVTKSLAAAAAIASLAHSTAVAQDGARGQGPSDDSGLPPTVVRVLVEGIDGRIGIGSGVPISRQTVATNCHVTRGARAMAVLVGEGVDAGRFPVASQAGDPGRDVCVLRTRKPLPVRPAAVGEAPRVGDRVLALAFPGGSDLRAHPGEVKARYALHDGDVLLTETAFDQGSSGGGLFNAAHELVGILTFHGGSGSRQFYSVPASWVSSVLADRPFLPVDAQGDGRAFWEEELENQPAFLRANAARAVR
jgi:serine protease Do